MRLDPWQKTLYMSLDKQFFQNRFRSLSASHPFFQVNFYITGKKYNGCVPEGFYCEFQFSAFAVIVMFMFHACFRWSNTEQFTTSDSAITG